jgi:hypothetical protein
LLFRLDLQYWGGANSPTSNGHKQVWTRRQVKG